MSDEVKQDEIEVKDFSLPSNETFDLLSQPVSETKELDLDFNPLQKEVKTEPVVKKEEKQEIEETPKNEEGDGGNAEGESEQEETESTEVNSLEVVYNELKDKGLFSELDEEDLKTIDPKTDEGFLKAWEIKENKFKESTYKQIASELSQEGVELINYLKNGGKVADFKQMYDFDVKSLDPKQDAEDVVRTYYQTFSPEMDESEVEELITNYKDTNKLEGKSGLLHTKLVDYQENQRKEFLTNQENQKKAAEVKRQETAQNIGKLITTSEKIGEFELPKDAKQKELFRKFVLEPSVKLKDGTKVTPYYAKKMEEANNQENFLMNAWLAFNDYKVSPSIEKKAKTEAAKSLSDKLRKVNAPTAVTKTQTTADDFQEMPLDPVWEQILNQK